MAQESEVEKSIENKKRGTIRGQLAPLSPFPTDEIRKPKTQRLSKSSIDYWRQKVRQRHFRNANGDECLTAELYVRLKHHGREAWLNLATANRAQAAVQARDLWVKVQANGLDSVIAVRRPARPEQVASVGDLISEVSKHARIRPRTLHQYFTAFRRVVSGVLKIPGSPSRYAPRSEANAAWRAKIDAIPLNKLTPAGIEAWRASEITHAADEADRKAREHSTASNIRNCRALFAKALLPILREKLTLPTPLPFEGLRVKGTTRRFESAVSPRHLYELAKCEFAESPDTHTAFLLLVIAGLRRGEADLLPWSNVDLAQGTLKVTTTPWFTPKSAESHRTIHLPPDVVAHLKVRREAAPSAEFVLEGTRPKIPGKTYEYRADAWPPLLKWLRKQGISDSKPLHQMRKMSGSLVNEIGGLEAARRHLGHASVVTTSASYLQTKPVVVDLSK